MKVELSFYGMKLDGAKSSDPFCVVTALATQPGTKAAILGQTETIHNTVSPHWVKVFNFDFELGTPIKIACSVFDAQKKSGGKPKSMGSAVFEVGALLGARGNTMAKKLKGGGTLFASVRKAAGSGNLRLHCAGSKLKNVEGMFSKSDPFFEISRKVCNAGGLTWDNVYRSNQVKNTLDPDWETAVLELSTICGGDLDLPLKIEVFDFESSGKHKRMGNVEMSVKGLQTAASTKTPVKLLQNGKDVGSLTIVQADVSGVTAASADVTDRMAAATISARSLGPPNFVDYVSGGCELNVVVAIDFTGSNGDPRVPGTLHHLDANSMNQYEKAISAIVSVLAQYDTDQKFPVLGFGAKTHGSLSHCFQCGDKDEVHGVNGVLAAYDQVFKSGLVMSGPTIFTEVMETAAARATSSLDAARSRGTQSYTILLIVTDGEVSDTKATAQRLDQISNAPLSVVIVGVGNANFSSMQFLDDAAGNGKRDIAQFVEFNKHSSNSVALTSETLREIPNQLVQFFQRSSIAPLPPMQRGDSLMNVAVEPEEEIDLTLDVSSEAEIVILGGGNDFVDGFGKGRANV